MSMEVESLTKKEEESRRYFKEKFGIDKKGPLSPEYLLGTYHAVEHYSRGRNRTAAMAEGQLKDYEDPKTREYLAAEAEQYRREGRTALEGTVKEIRGYVKKNNGAYYEQAKADMAADLAKRPEAEKQFASTKSDIEDLPEVDFKSTEKDIQDLPESNGPNN